jgi:hypothetical protein
MAESLSEDNERSEESNTAFIVHHTLSSTFKQHKTKD